MEGVLPVKQKIRDHWKTHDHPFKGRIQSAETIEKHITKQGDIMSEFVGRNGIMEEY